MNRGKPLTYDQEAAVMAYMLGDSLDKIAERLGVPRQRVQEGVAKMNTWRALDWIRAKQGPISALPVLPVIEIKPGEKVDIQQLLCDVKAWLDGMKAEIQKPNGNFTIKEQIAYGLKISHEIAELPEKLIKVEEFAKSLEVLDRWERFEVAMDEILRLMSPGARDEILAAMHQRKLIRPTLPASTPKEIGP
jgi:hypothetical protein